MGRDVRLEVLDWGGEGQPLVLLAGLNFTAHAFDDIAPHLARQFRVIAITRRGFGASSHPDSGYDPDTLAEDVRAVLDSLEIRRAVLVGHSMGGEEITRVALRWPERVSHLIYLDAPMVPTNRLTAVMAQVPHPPPPSEQDLATVSAYANYLQRIAGVRIPESEVRSTNRISPEGRVEGSSTRGEVLGAILAESTQPPLRDLQLPVLVIRAVPRTPASAIPWYDHLPDSERTTIVQLFDDFVDLLNAGWAPFAEVENLRWLDVPDANHHVYLSHQQGVLSAISEFITSPH